MALRTPLTAQPHLYIGDSTGRPLDYGRVYFGEPNKDPEFYPIDIYLDPEMTIAAAQPVRTKGGFMDVGGNLAELHAAEVIYSLKVLDQYGRQVFYKPEMYRNNVSDFLVDEITRATAAETLIAGNLTTETQRAIAAEKVIADAVVTEKDRAIAAEVLLDDKYEGLSTTIGSIGGGKKAYTTEALMIADKANILANSSIDVTNDPVSSKNGTYSYDGAVFAKSIYDPLAQAKTYADSNALFRPVLIESAIDLDTLKLSGAYLCSAPVFATLALNYPKSGLTGVLRVTTAGVSSLITQEFSAVTGELFTRRFNGATWSTWVDFGASFAKSDKTLSFKEQPTATDNLNDFKTNSLRLISTTPSNWAELNYPAKLVGVLQVFEYPTTSFIIQQFIADNGMYVRRSAGGVWGSWLSVLDTGYVLKEVLGTQNLNDLKKLGVYIKNSGITGSTALNYPTLKVGVLKVYQGDATSAVFQEYVASDGVVYSRFWNNIVWSDWASSTSSSGGLATTGFSFNKTAKLMQMMFATSNSSKFIRVKLERQVNLSVNRDVWGITGCDVVDDSGALLLPITTSGVWATAILDSENAGDHSGGSHGDEALSDAFFMIDGVYYPQDAVISGRAKSIQFRQRSTIYVESSPTVICNKDLMWDITDGELNLDQTLIYPAERTLYSAWITMLPVLRKTNQDNTGEQVTDIEIRSKDGVVVNVGEPDFELRKITIGNGDSIALSSSVSGVGVSVTINEIGAGINPYAYVQNTAAYNKIYVSGKSTDVSYATTPGEQWHINSTFKVNTI